jgi:hypothetical protein
MMIIFMITGIVCYASFSPPVPDEPMRIMFQTKAGKVLFTHSVHSFDYTSDCVECHHLTSFPPGYDCSECHFQEGDALMLSREDAFHDQCIKCHDDMGEGPVECDACHSL